MKTGEEHFFDFFLDPEYVSDHMLDEQLQRSLYRKFKNKNHYILSAYPRKNKIVKLIKKKRAALRENGKTRVGCESELENIERLTAFLCNPSPISGMTARRALVDFDSSKDWHQNLLNQEKVMPFTGVLSDTSSGSQGYIDFESRWDHRLLELESSSLRTPRKASQLAARCKKMIMYSDELFFIDPNFKSFSPRFTNVMKEVLRIAYRHRVKPLSRVEFIVRFESKDDSEYEGLKREALKSLPDLIPRGETLTLRYFKNRDPYDYQKDENTGGFEKLHDRFILTENFGLLVPYGLDEDPRKIPEDKVSTTSVTRLSVEDHESWLHDYTDEYNPAFETSYPELLIEGRRDV